MAPPSPSVEQCADDTLLQQPGEDDMQSPCRSPSVMSAPDLSPTRMLPISTDSLVASAVEPISKPHSHFRRPASLTDINDHDFEFAPLLSGMPHNQRNGGLLPAIEDSQQDRGRRKIGVACEAAPDQLSDGQMHEDQTPPAAKPIQHLDIVEALIDRVSCQDMPTAMPTNALPYGQTADIQLSAGEVHPNAIDPPAENGCTTNNDPQTAICGISQLKFQSDNGPKDDEGSAAVNDSAVEGQGTNRACRQERAERMVQKGSIQQPKLNERYRVKKPTAFRASHPLSSKTMADDAPRILPEHMSSSEGPSDEDLLLLMMRRRRSKDAKMLNTAAQNKTLLAELEAIKQKHNASIQAHDVVINKYEREMEANRQLKEHLQSSQAKYQRLKTWALEFNREYANLQQQSIELKDQLSELSTDRESLTSQIKVAQKLQAMLQDSDLKRRTQATDLKSSLEALEVQLSRRQTEHERLLIELRAERSWRKKLEIHICETIKIQTETRSQMAAQTSSITATVERLLNKARCDQATISDTDVSQCLSLLQKLWDKAIESSAENTDRQAQLSSLVELTSSLTVSTATKNDVLQCTEVQRGCSDRLETLQKAVMELKLTLPEILHIKDANCRLEEKVSSGDKIQVMLETDRNSAQQRVKDLETYQIKLVDQAIISNEAQFVSLQKLVTDSEKSLSTVVDRYNTQSQETTSRCRSLEDENSRLRQQVEEAESIRHQEISESEAALRQQLTDLEEQLERNDIDANIILSEEAKRHEIVIHDIQGELYETEARWAACQVDLDQCRKSCKSLNSQRETYMVEIKQLQQQLELKNSDFTMVKNELNSAQLVVERSDLLEERLQASNQQVAKLESRVAVLASVEAQHHDCSSEKANLGHEISKLKEKLQAAKVSSAAIDELGRKLVHLQSDSEVVCEQLRVARNEAQEVQTLRDKLQLLTVELANSKEALDLAQIAEKRANGLEQEKDILEAQLFSLREDLLEAEKEVNEAKFQAQLIQEKDKQLKSHAEQIKETCAQLSDARVEIEIKSTEIEELQKELRANRTSRSCTTRDRAILSERLSTQDLLQLSQSSIQLSIPDINVPDSQSPAKPFLQREVAVSHLGTEYGNGDCGINPQLTIHNAQVDYDTHQTDVSRSQVEDSTGPEIPETLIENYLPSSSISELTDLSESFLSLPSKRALYGVTSGQREPNNMNSDSPGADLVSPQKAARFRRNGAPKSPRPHTTTSQESMLLQATPRSRPRTIQTTNDPTDRDTMTPAVLHENGQTYDSRAPVDSEAQEDVADQPIDPHVRERHRPNSAVKRQRDSSSGELLGNQKRLKCNPGNLSMKIPFPASAATSRQTQSSSTSSIRHDLPSGSRSGSTVSASVTSYSHSQRRSTRNKTFTKAEKYSQRFGTTK